MPAAPTVHEIAYGEQAVRSLDPGGEQQEWVWVVLFLLLFLLVNVITADRYPFPFLDEVFYTDPAVNYLTGHGFTTTVLGLDSPIFYFYNGPAHSALLIPWLQVFGISMRSVRSINFAYMAIAVVLIWSAAKRIPVVFSTRMRLLLVSMLVCDYSIIFSYRCGRYDCLGMLVVAFAFWSFSLASTPLRLTALSIVGAASPWIGLQLLPLEAVLAGTLLVFTLSRYWREIFAFFTGVATGGLGLLGFFASHGVLRYFFEFLNSQSKGIGFFGSLLHGEFRHSNMLPKDFSLPLVACAIVLLAFASYRRHSLRLHSLLTYGLISSVVLALTLIAVGKFPTYYGWMIYIPLAICVCGSLDLAPPTTGRRYATALCVVASIVGVSLHVLACARDWKDRDYSKVQQFVNANVRPDDWAYVSPQAYFPAKLTGATTLFWDPGTWMSPDQKDRVTVCVIDPKKLWVLKVLGGTWYNTGPDLIPVHTGLFGSEDRWGFLSLPNYRLSVYRRVPMATAASDGKT